MSQQKKPQQSSESPVFNALHQALAATLLNKAEPTQNELKALRVLNAFSDGLFGSEVLEVHSQLPLDQIKGRSILKLTKTPVERMRTEEERYHQLGSLKQIFADLRWSARIKDPDDSEKIYSCSFWQAAQNQVPLADMQSVSALLQQDHILRALQMSSKAVLNHSQLDDAVSDQAFAHLCKQVLGKRCDPIKGRIYPFVRRAFNISNKSPTFTWQELTLPNPFYYARHAESLTLLATYYGNAHSDLHPGNIFVSLQPEHEQVCLIDSGFSEHRFPLFYDQAYLELSMLIRAELSQNENPQQWLQLFEALNDESHLGLAVASTAKSLLPDYMPFYEQVRAVRSTFTDFLHHHSGQASEIRKQYHLMRICASLNFCNKSLPTEAQRKFAYLYAAFQLKAFIERYGDDQSIAECKLALKDQPDYLYQSEHREYKNIEQFWRKWSMPNRQQTIVLEALLTDFDQLPFVRQLIPASRLEDFVTHFLNSVWPRAYKQCQTSEEHIALLGVLGKAIQYQLYPLSVALNETYSPLLDVIESEQAWRQTKAQQALSFIAAVVEDALFHDNQPIFERGCNLMSNLITHLEPAEQKYWQHCLTHAHAKWQSMHLNISDLRTTLETWQPEKDDELMPEWLIKKAMIMVTCYAQQLDPAFKVLSAGLTQLDLWSFQMQSHFLEAYLILRGTFRIHYDSPPEDAMAKMLKNKGFSGIQESLKDWEQTRKPPSQPPRNGQYSLAWHAQDPAVSDALHAMKGISLLMRSGHLPMICNRELVSTQTWESINDRLFKRFPQLCFYYSLQYLFKNPVDAEWVRVQLQKYLLSQHTEQHKALKPIFYGQLQQVFKLLQGHDRRLYMLILAVMSEFIPVLPYRDWQDVFVTVWEEFNQEEKHKILYSRPLQGPYLLIWEALSRIEDSELLSVCLATLLTTDGDFDAGYYIRHALLHQIVHHPEFDSLDLTPALEQAVSATITALQNKETKEYALIKLRLIDSKLKPEHRQAIAEQFLQWSRLPGYTSRTFPILIYFTANNTQARQHLHALLLAEKHRIWETGITQNSDGSWERDIGGSFIYPLHSLKRTATFPEGLSFSEPEVWEIYSALKSALTAFRASPFAQSGDHFLGSGLDFTMLKEINYFLEDYRTILAQNVDYAEIKEDIMTGIHEHVPSSGRPADLISETPNTVLEGIDRLLSLLREADFDALSDYWNNLLSKILLQAQPHLLKCLEILSYWLVYYREEAYFQKPFFMQMYIQILERYQQAYPGEKQDHAEIEAYLVDLALVLDFWGTHAPGVAHFLKLKQTSVYEEVRQQTGLSQRKAFTPPAIEAQSVFQLLKPEQWKLSALQIQGFKSFSSVSATSVTFHPMNILIGANGSGKSSLLSLFSFVQGLAKMPLDSIGATLGQAGDLLFYGPKQTPSFSVALTFKNQGLQLVYRLSCEINQNRSHLFLRDEEITWQTDTSKPESLKHSEPHTESLLLSRKQEPAVQALKTCLAGIQFFHLPDTSRDAPVRKPAQLHDDQGLASDAGNLAAVLYRLRSQQKTEKKHYRLLRSVIQRVFRQFDDFILEPNLEKQLIPLKWSEVGASDYHFSAQQVSDGTLRFMAMVTLLLQPPEHLPRMIILDEPELGLHPTALGLLAELLEQASQHCQLMIATQSGDLLNHFSADDIMVIDRTQMVNEQFLPQYATRLSRKNESELAAWLEDYTLEELWHKNVLGGKP